MVKVALLQFNVVPGDVEQNRRTAEEYINQAAGQGAEIVILPELWNCGYVIDQMAVFAETANDKSIALMKKLAIQNNIFIFAGSIVEKKGGKCYNSCIVINQNGDIQGKYRKIHLISVEFNEPEYFTSGDEFGLIETPWGKAGIILCYDLRFPELARNLALRGAEFLIIPSQWPESRLEVFNLLCRSRAIENQFFVLAANAGIHKSHNPQLYRSMVISPLGEIIAHNHDVQDIVMAEIDLEAIKPVRQQINVFAGRRSLLDEIDDSQI